MRLTGKRIAILLADGVEDLEFHVPAMRLQEEGAEVIAAGITLDPVRGKHGLEISPTATIESLASSELQRPCWAAPAPARREWRSHASVVFDEEGADEAQVQLPHAGNDALKLAHRSPRLEGPTPRDLGYSNLYLS
jgi:putative intracellular protease/amidase